MANLITWVDKIAVSDPGGLPENKWRAVDINELKEVVNTNATEQNDHMANTDTAHGLDSNKYKFSLICAFKSLYNY